MPLEPSLKKPIIADWFSQVVDMSRRLVAFKDLSEGKVTSWKWDFGDGGSSSEQNPIHTYEKAGRYTVVLYVEGPAGKARRAKVWHVALK
jgi:PKD repeat protein